MSELKARHIVDVYDSYYAENPFGERSQVYLKPEADKVIAELKADYQEACDRLQTANLIKDELLAAIRQLKFKRCLGNAAKYLWKRNYWRDSTPAYERQHQWENMAYKHYKRWLELAEKFKEAVNDTSGICTRGHDRMEPRP